MASVRSLGLHQPACLGRAIDELALGRDDPSAYNWDFTIRSDDEQDIEDELLVTEYCVFWSRGGIFLKSFNFEIDGEPIVQALLTYFPQDATVNPAKTTTFNVNQPRPNLKPKALLSSKTQSKPSPRFTLSKALVVILKTQLRIHFVSGTSHTLHLPFEVESACAAPQGVILQRRLRTESAAPLAFKFPKVPPNSFVSSQIASSIAGASQQTFSVEGLGKPKVLPLRLSSTLENMWEPPLEHSDSNWPRLVSLIDPLQEVGLIVTQPDTSTRNRRRTIPSHSPYFLDPAEEILHVESVTLPECLRSFAEESLVLAVTLNRDTSRYGVWRVTYIDNGDPFIRKKRVEETKPDRRRSSMQPSIIKEPAAPAQPSVRESFGATLPGKRTRRSERLEKSEKGDKGEKGSKIDKPLDLVSSLDPEKEVTTSRRQSRRVSSMLARADLSASQERSMFAEQPFVPNHGSSRRIDSNGNQSSRLSGGHGSLLNNQTIHPNLGRLLEAPVETVLDELRAGGDFEGFHSMGLDDHDFDGLAQEMTFTKIDSISLDSSNVRYSVSNQPARAQSKVFILKAPGFAAHSHPKSEIMVGIQDTVDKKLQLLKFDIHKTSKPPAPGPVNEASTSSSLLLTREQHFRAHPVVDSCKVIDGGMSAILLLSEGPDNQRQLSIQAPWLEKTSIILPRLMAENERSLHYAGRPVHRDVRQRRSEALEANNGSIRALRFSRPGGLVDVVDAEQRHHQMQIQLQPTNPLVRRILETCRCVLPSTHSKRVLPSWWLAMLWLRKEHAEVADLEWSGLVIHIFAMFLTFSGGETNVATPRRSSRHQRRAQSGSFGSMKDVEDWRTLQLHEAPNALAYAPWQQKRAWEWTLSNTHHGESSRSAPTEGKFLQTHLRYTKAFLASNLGNDGASTPGSLRASILRNSDAPAAAVFSSVFVGLHMLLEELKLDVMVPEYSSPGTAELRVVMCQVAHLMKWHDFAAIYELGVQDDIESQSGEEFSVEFPQPQPVGVSIDVLDWIRVCLTGRKALPLLSPFASGPDQQLFANPRWDLITPRITQFKRLFDKLNPDSSMVDVLEAMHASRMDKNFLESLPEGVLTPLQDAISRCQPAPPAFWPAELLELVNRKDVGLVRQPHLRPSFANTVVASHLASWDYSTLCQSVEESSSTAFEDGDSTERQTIVGALFKDDRRLNEAQDLLSTHRPRVVQLQPDPLWSESEYLERQKQLVSRVATGTLAIPAGRALLYYGSRFPLLTQKLHVGGFNLNCIVRPSNVTVGVDKSQYTEEKVCWGFFHQGVAAGLTISPRAKGIDTSWILYNKPGPDLSNRHAGFLLALGLNGHLKGVAKWVAFKYLTPKHTMTSIGLLLGLAASYLGTMDSLITRLLSVHVTRMLPRGAAELNLSHLTQTTGIMGIGLLYCGSQHRRMSEIMMSEIEYVEEDEEEEPLRSESYRLAAGFSLGFINLGKGNDLKGLHDMRLTEKLITIATATKKVEMVHVLDRAAAGAVMALAMIFMKSENHMVARKIDVPDSVVQFDYIRPDILLLRTVAKNLILWSKMGASFDWISGNLPKPYRARHKLLGITALKSTDLPFFSILAGLCFSLALRFAGSGSLRARDILVHYLDQFIRISGITQSKTSAPFDRPVYDEELARSNARMCQDILALSAALVMAGTGDLVVLRRLRALHGRDDIRTPYGSHLATHLAIGSLFLGCGTTTFGNSNLAIGSLLVAFFPVLPISVKDNRTHLQAFRHFWVLATDPRCLVTKDITTGQPISVPVTIRMKKSLAYSSSERADDGTLIRNTPCLLPPLSDIDSLETNASPSFWDLKLDLAANPDLVASLSKNQNLYLRRRPLRQTPFKATLQALGRDVSAEFAHDAGQQNPFEWVFRTETLSNITRAEQALVLDRDGCPDGPAESSNAVDARLVLNQSIDCSSRERLQNLKLLFDWSDARSVIRRTTDLPKEAGSQRYGGEADDEDLDGWWLRDSVIETLKGQVFLASRGSTTTEDF